MSFFMWNPPQCLQKSLSTHPQNFIWKNLYLFFQMKINKSWYTLLSPFRRQRLCHHWVCEFPNTHTYTMLLTTFLQPPNSIQLNDNTGLTCIVAWRIQHSQTRSFRCVETRTWAADKIATTADNLFDNTASLMSSLASHSPYPQNDLSWGRGYTEKWLSFHTLEAFIYAFIWTLL